MIPEGDGHRSRYGQATAAQRVGVGGIMDGWTSPPPPLSLVQATPSEGGRQWRSRTALDYV